MQQRTRARLGEKPKMPAHPPPVRPEHVSLARTKAAEITGRPGTPDRMEDQVAQMEGVYIISVAARILDMHPQTLRKYEKLGLINPGRTLGMLRLYSREDIRKVRLIRHLAGNLGLNLAGVEFAMGMVDNLLRLTQRMEAAAKGSHLEHVIEQEMAALFQAMDLPVED